MTDIFREVDEDIRRERMKSAWQRYSRLIIAGAVLIVVAAAAYRLYEYWQTRQAAATGDRFAAAMDLARSGNQLQADLEFNSILSNGTGKYPTLAAMRVASTRAAAGDPTGAAGAFQAIADDTGEPKIIRDLAQLRAAMLLVDTTSYTDLRPRLEALAAAGEPFQYSAREILGLSAFRAGDLTAARGYFQTLADQQNVPAGIARRASTMLDLIAARGGAAPPAEG